jgi:hypothetical protein
MRCDTLLLDHARSPVMVFAIEKVYALVATLLSLEIGVCHPYGLV